MRLRRLIMQETQLNGESLNIVSENVSKLKELFPEILTEDKIDFDKLKAVLGNYIEDDIERYNFTWKGKADALRLSQTPSTGTLRPCKDESKNWDRTENLYIEGDNLEVLKLLQKSYYGKIKMIYIDPPYNTGKDFIYRDNYKESRDDYHKTTLQVDQEGAKLSTNTESSGRFHTNWLNMMYPRLRLALNLLTGDGVIFISINDNESDNLKKLCNEIFGEENFVNQLIWRNKSGGVNDSKYFGVEHEYILCYAKSIAKLPNLFTKLNVAHLKDYKYKDDNFSKYGGYKRYNLHQPGIDDNRPNLQYVIKAPDGTDIDIRPKIWRWSKERVLKAQKNGEIDFIKNKKTGQWQVFTKIYLHQDGNERRVKPRSLLLEQGFTLNGNREVQKLFGQKVFSYPKPSSLIKFLVEIITHENRDAIILDFFAGSSTTADAIMQLNSEDNGKRKFIMVQIDEPTDEKSIAFKEGYKSISKLSKERIKKAGDAISSNNENYQKTLLDSEIVPEIDFGFKVFKWANSNLIKWDPDNANIEQSLLDNVNNIVPGRSKLDLIYEIMLKFGINLILPIDEYQVNDGKTIYSIGFGALIICLDDNINLDISSEIIRIKDKLSPEITRVVFKDNGFATDSDKTNVKETLKTHGIDEFVTI